MKKKPFLLNVLDYRHDRLYGGGRKGNAQPFITVLSYCMSDLMRHYYRQTVFIFGNR